MCRSWETVLDLDALNKEEVNPKTGEPENWVWKGSTVLDEGPDVRTDRVMLKLSRGGADATGDPKRGLKPQNRRWTPALLLTPFGGWTSRGRGA
jgi:hypothetical protein